MGAQVNLKATYEVAIHTEFHAEAGSEFHAYIEPVGIPCSDIANDQFKMIAIQDTGAAASDPEQKFITLRIASSPNRVGVSVHPNPSPGLFTLDFATEEATTGELLIRNSLGALVGSAAVQAGPNTIDLRGKPPGLYFLTIRLLDGSLFNRKLVLQ